MIASCNTRDIGLIAGKTKIWLFLIFPDRTDGDNGISHSLAVDGKTILTVNEKSKNLPDNAGDDDMGIQFIEVRKLQDGTIQGYVQVSMVIGDFDTDLFGLCVLSLTVKRPDSPVILSKHR